MVVIGFGESLTLSMTPNHLLYKDATDGVTLTEAGNLKIGDVLFHGIDRVKITSISFQMIVPIR